MNFFSVFKGSHRLSQLINQVLMICLWSSVVLFLAIAVFLMMEGWNWENLRMSLVYCGIAVILLFFTLLLQRSINMTQKPNTVKEYYELALWTEESQGIRASQKIYEEMIQKFDRLLGPAYLSLASIYLKQQDEEKAEQMIEQAAREDWVWYLPGLEMLFDYYCDHQSPLQEKLSKKIDRVKKLEEQASEEIYYFSESDSFEPNDQSVEAFFPVIRILQSYLPIQELYIVKKKLTTIPDRKVYVFAVTLDPKNTEQVKQCEEKIYQDCYEILAQPLGKYLFFAYTISFIFLNKKKVQDHKLLQKLAQVSGSQVNLAELQ